MFPTICQIIDEEYRGYGYSLFLSNEPQYIISEEHGSFRPQVNQPIEYWAVIKKDVIYLRSYDGYFRDDKKAFELDKQSFDSFLCEKSLSFRETIKQLQILDLYKTMATDKSFYTNGEKRHKINKYDILSKIKLKLNWNKKREF